jgi:hypothetical protein
LLIALASSTRKSVNSRGSDSPAEEGCFTSGPCQRLHGPVSMKPNSVSGKK